MQESSDLDRSLTRALRALADDARDGASIEVEERLLAEVRLLRRARRRTPIKLLAIAAVLVMAVTVPIWQIAGRPPAAAPPSASGDLDGDTTEFYPLAFSNVPVT